MITTGLKSVRFVESGSEEIKVTETFEPTYWVKIESEKRVEPIHIVKTNVRNSFFKIIYATGASIPELSGSYTSPGLAVEEVIKYLERTGPTVDARANKRHGNKPVPELKTIPKERQGRRKKRSKAKEE